jgi:uncharacterized protein (TIGR02246 family)
MPARTPKQCDDLFAKFVEAGDVDAVVALYEPKGCLVLEGGRVARGPAAIRKAIAMFAAMKPKFRMNVGRIVKAGDDIAVLYNDWTLSATGPDGAAVTDQGKATEIVRRQGNGTWRFVVDDPRARG